MKCSCSRSRPPCLFSIVGSLTLCEKLFTLWERLLRDRCLKPLYNHANSLADGAMPPLMHSRRQLILANAPSTPQISLPSRSGHTALRCCDFSGPNTIFWTQIIYLHFGDCLQWNFVLFAVKCHGVSPLSTAVRAIHRSR